MKLVKLFGVLIALAGAGVLAVVVAAQDRPNRDERRGRDLAVLAGRGGDLGLFVRDEDAGVTVDEVRPDGPGARAGLKRSDVIVEFDGERVRSARQFSRLVQEAPPGRTVKATVLRDKQRTDVQIVVPEPRRAELFGDLAGRLPPFNFDFDLPEIASGRRLGVTVQEMPDQLASYFGAKDGVLITAVTDGGPASRAGLKAGDVITSIEGRQIHSRQDLVRALRDTAGDQVEIGIVRDKKPTTVKATVEAPRRRTFRASRQI
jgi:serine protease Do